MEAGRELVLANERVIVARSPRWLGCWVRTRAPAASSPRDVGVVTVVTDQMEPGRWNMHQQPGEELAGVEGLTSTTWRPLVAVAGKPRLEGESLE